MKTRRKSIPVFFKTSVENIDRSSGIIKGCVVGQQGKDKHGDLWDEVFLGQIVTLGNASGVGVKSRFGHPNMCDSKIDSFIGRYKNFSLSKNADGKTVVIADLHLDEISKALPGKGDVFTYMMDMATKNSDMFGNSIAYIPAIPESKTEKDESGKDVLNYYERLASLLAVDVVDSPAATDNLFKDSNDLAATVTDFLEDHPEIYEVIEKDESVLNSFIQKYKNYKTEKNKMKKPVTTAAQLKAKNKAAELKVKMQELLDATAPEAKSFDAKTSEGMSITISDENGDGAPAAGDTCTMTETGEPCAAGDMELEDGTKITCDDKGVITSVLAVESAPAEPEQKDDNQASDEVKKLQKTISDLKAKNKSLEKTISEMELEHTDTIETLTKSVDTLEVRLKKLEGNHVPEVGATKFSKEQKEEKRDPKTEMQERKKAYKSAPQMS